MVKAEGIKVLVKNRKARHNFHIIDTYEAGLSLQGTEVKSIRAGKANIGEAYARIINGECILSNMHVSPYDPGNRFNHEPLRPRRLLLHKREIKRLHKETKLKGNTLIPLRLYLKNGLVKVEIAVAKGKQEHDKRQDAAKHDAERRARAAEGNRRKGR